MKYKAIFLDIDGTIVTYDKPMDENLPSIAVKKAIQKAAEKIEICFATGRPYFLLKKILEFLEIEKGYLVINDGGQVIDNKTKKVLYERVMDKEDMGKAVKILNDFLIEFFLNDNEKERAYTSSYVPEKPYNIFAPIKYPEKKIDEVIDILSDISGIKANKTHGGREKMFGLVVSHAEATKMHGIFEIQKLLGIKRNDTIGVGDSGNDFPLLMASGLKVAMGNAIPSLKDISDYVAPTVDEDGVVKVIEKFVLNIDKTG